MAKPRTMTERRGFAFLLGIAIIKPLLLLLTRRDWRDGSKLPATGGVVIVSNHLSHLDPFTFAHFVYDHGRLPRFLAKAEVFDVPVIGALVTSMGQIPVRRLSSEASVAFDAGVEAVRDGKALIVYPEGTLTRDPDLWPMVGKTGAARIALTAGVPVVPVAQWGPQEVLPPYAARPRLFPRKTMRMLTGDPVDLDDLRGRPVTPEILREATERIMDAITALLEDVRGERAPSRRYDPREHGVRLIGNPRRRRSRSESQ